MNDPAGRQCETWEKSRRCARELGHDGPHDCGYSFWTTAEEWAIAVERAKRIVYPPVLRRRHRAV